LCWQLAAKEEAPAPAPVASAPAAPVNTEEKVLNIYNWPDYVPEGMIAAFEKETGIKVNYDTFETNEALQRQAGGGKHGLRHRGARHILQPGANRSRLLPAAGQVQAQNYANLDPSIMMGLVKADPGNAHLVPWAWGFTTVGINRTKVEKALGKMAMPENAWDLVFKPEYTSKLKSCGIAYLDSPTEIIPPALHYIGKDAYSQRPGRPQGRR